MINYPLIGITDEHFRKQTSWLHELQLLSLPLEIMRLYFLWDFLRIGTCGLVAMTSASHAEGRQFDPGQVYFEVVHFRNAVPVSQFPNFPILRNWEIAKLRNWENLGVRQNCLLPRD